MWRVPVSLLTLAVSTIAVASDPPGSGKTKPVDYAGQIKPILTRHCVSCHGAVKPRGSLRLDTSASALKGGKAGPVILPGKGEESPLILSVRGEWTTERMPLKRPPLSEAEITLLQAWIDQGANGMTGERPGVPPVATHWAFLPPKRPAVPNVRTADWARNPIDRFILARLDQAGLAPSPAADPATLLRRVSLDVIGLPPSPDELEGFLSDPSSIGYERVVDRLLASPHFGERWARPWLDQARYADSNGYNIDAPRSIWKYRDWVIAAFNADMPFDRFAIDQIAGDLQPGAAFPQRIATGFHRNTQINQEGGIDAEQFRIESIVDRVSTTGTVFLGLTVGCASATITSLTRSASESITDSSPSSITRTSPSWRSPHRRSWPGVERSETRSIGCIATWLYTIRISTSGSDGGRPRSRSNSRRPRMLMSGWHSTRRGRNGRSPSAARWSS